MAKRWKENIINDRTRFEQRDTYENISFGQKSNHRFKRNFHF